MAASAQAGILDGVRVLDGALATELEAHGANLDGPLWSAQVLEASPDKILAVHRSYLA
ncbi:MAG: homocysteine S-methyltransferase family protein, partial [Acidobacteriota bacterium]